ncbi:PucR family transcriptional regulator [Deinococcus maricopensis]|uniref:Transcriptional regulator, CdaR n=1 Tax=Deinococcus maricopensis (strain DSM 21211 / LMG 22137 / NRRL B-23946 / LB-34) TaxID=709986 RepID=E8U8Y7_DEIML|nr:PucR family transcriptional regulator [Deinococcus maricopensis]ADV67526.1 transcriptional regulator, CdaR [Deinococcus maricopensis DSM 21211]
MATFNTLRRRLGLPLTEPDAPLHSVADALAALPHLPHARVHDAALAILAHATLHTPGSPDLLHALTGTLHSPRPERDLADLLARLSGGYAEVRASWGDIIAFSGTPGGPPQAVRLEHEGRHVGTLSLAAPAEWTPLLHLAAPFARLARLQTAAAGAARRRVGERLLEALLSGEAHEEGEPCAVGVLALHAPYPRSTRAREAREHALDVLAGAGEGYFRERGLAAYTTVRRDRAVWLWHSLDPEREARDLHAALLAATSADVRLGVSLRHPGYAAAPTALRQASQALDGTTAPRAYTTYTRLDPLHALLHTDATGALRDHVRARLAPHDADGKLTATLRAYLAHAGPLPALAERLNVHPNTLRYRLRRAEEALGVDLRRPDALARLYLALGHE